MIAELAKIGRDLVEFATQLRREKALQHVKRHVNRTNARAVQIKLHDAASEQIAESIEPMFKRQYDSAAKRLRGKSGTDAAKLAKQIFNPRDWDDELIDRIFPPIADVMAEAAKTSLEAVGVRLGKGSKDTRSSLRAPLTPMPLAEKASTATEWLDANGIGEIPTGIGGIRISTEYPDWLKEKIAEELQETFSQDYWQEINDTTRDDIQQILKVGLQDGQSITTMAAKIAGTSSEYSKIRGRLVARTEAAHAVNGGRDAGIQGLKEELGDAGKFIGKSWLSVLGSTTRDSHANLDGKLADKDGNWLLGGVSIPWPGHISLPVGERANCQCTILTEILDAEVEELIEEQEEVLAGREEKPKHERRNAGETAAKETN